MGRIFELMRSMVGNEKSDRRKKRELEYKKRNDRLVESDKFELRDINAAQKTEE